MERVIALLAQNFAKREGVVVHLILTGRDRKIEYGVPEAVIIHRPDFPFDNSKRTWHTLKTMAFIRRSVKRINPDTILSFGEMWNNLVLLGLYGLNYSVFISDRSQPNKDLGRLQNKLRDWLYPKATGYIAQTSQAREVARRNRWNENIKVIGNPIREITPNPTVEKENIVLFVGRLIRTRHVDQLIRMFHEVRLPDWKLEIVGGDAKKLKLSAEYQQLIEYLGAAKYISLEGVRKNVDDYYNKSKIFAFPSSSEGFPNVIGEALSAGLPVLTYDCMAGPSDMIEDGENGYLIPLMNEERFKNDLRKLMADDDHRMKLAERAKLSIQKFRMDDIAQQFFDFITE